MNTSTVKVSHADISAVVEPVSFTHATLAALQVLAGNVDFDVEGKNGFTVPGMESSSKINRALLALQHFARERGVPARHHIAVVQRFLALTNTNCSHEAFGDLVHRDEKGNAVAYSAHLIAAAATAPLPEPSSVKQPEFDIEALIFIARGMGNDVLREFQLQ